METLTTICQMYEEALVFLARHSIVFVAVGSFLLDAYIVLVYLMIRNWKEKGHNPPKETVWGILFKF